MLQWATMEKVGIFMQMSIIIQMVYTINGTVAANLRESPVARIGQEQGIYYINLKTDVSHKELVPLTSPVHRVLHSPFTLPGHDLLFCSV